MNTGQLIFATIGLLLWFGIGYLTGNLSGWSSGFDKGYRLGRGDRKTRLVKKEIIHYEDKLDERR